MGLLKVALLTLSVCVMTKAVPRWPTFGNSADDDRDGRGFFGPTPFPNTRTRSNSGSFGGDSWGSFDSFSNRGGRSGGRDGSGSGFRGSNHGDGSWNNGKTGGSAAGASSKAVGPNSRVQTSSNTRFDLHTGASSSGSSFHTGDFGESEIDLDLFTGSAKNNGRGGRRGGSAGRFESKQRPDENFGAFGRRNGADDFGDFGSFSGVSLNGKNSGFGSGGVSGSLSSSGANFNRRNFNRRN